MTHRHHHAASLPALVLLAAVLVLGYAVGMGLFIGGAR